VNGERRSAAKGRRRQKGNGGQLAGVAKGIGGSKMVARCGLSMGQTGNGKREEEPRATRYSSVRGNKTRGSKTRLQTNLEITPTACAISLFFSLALSPFSLFFSFPRLLNLSYLLIINYLQMCLVPPLKTQSLLFLFLFSFVSPVITCASDKVQREIETNYDRMRSILLVAHFISQRISNLFADKCKSFLLVSEIELNNITSISIIQSQKEKKNSKTYPRHR